MGSRAVPNDVSRGHSTDVARTISLGGSARISVSTLTNCRRSDDAGEIHSFLRRQVDDSSEFACCRLWSAFC